MAGRTAKRRRRRQAEHRYTGSRTDYTCRMRRPRVLDLQPANALSERMAWLPDALRTRGAAKRAPAPPPAPAAAPAEWRLFAVAAPGLEAVVAAEVGRLAGAHDVAEVTGGVEAIGGTSLLWRANLELAVATRVLARLGEVTARRVQPLAAGPRAAAVARVLDGPRVISVTATTHGCRLYHTARSRSACNWPSPTSSAPTPSPTRAAAPNARRPRAGPARPLHRERRLLGRAAAPPRLADRGWPGAAARDGRRRPAPARRVGSAHRPRRIRCAARARILLEAAGRALGRPGGGRSFAFEAWPGFDPARYRALVAELQARAAPAPPAPLVGFDHDAAVIAWRAATPSARASPRT